MKNSEAVSELVESGINDFHDNKSQEESRNLGGAGMNPNYGLTGEDPFNTITGDSNIDQKSRRNKEYADMMNEDFAEIPKTGPEGQAKHQHSTSQKSLATNSNHSQGDKDQMQGVQHNETRKDEINETLQVHKVPANMRLSQGVGNKVFESAYIDNQAQMQEKLEIKYFCDDHWKYEKKKVEATHFCTDSKVFCCANCVLEYHIESAKQAKKIDKVLKDSISHLQETLALVEEEQSNSSKQVELIAGGVFDTIKSSIDPVVDSLENDIKSLQNTVQNMKNSKSKLVDFLTSHYKTLFDDEIQEYTDKIDLIASSAKGSIASFRSENTEEKGKLLKEGKVQKISNQMEAIKKMFAGSIEEKKSSTEHVESNINGLLREFIGNFNPKVDLSVAQIIDRKAEKLNGLIGDSLLKENLQFASNPVEERIKPQKGEHVPMDEFNMIKPNFGQENRIPAEHFSLNNNPPKQDQFQPQRPVQPNANHSDRFNMDKISPDAEKSVVSGKKEEAWNMPSNEFKGNSGAMAEKPNDGLSNFQLSEFDFFSKPQAENNGVEKAKESTFGTGFNKIEEAHNFCFFVNKGQSLFILKDGELKQVPISAFEFEDSNRFDQFPENSRFANFDNGIVFAGGRYQGKVLKSAFILNVFDDGENFSVIVENLQGMNVERERHNIIYIKEKATIMVNSGFHTKEVESLNLGLKKWEKHAPLSVSRANGTMVYLNNRYVLTIGGFVFAGSQHKNGEYLSSYEVFDFENPNAPQKVLEPKQTSLNLCAMGVVSSNDGIMLVGGFNGKTFVNGVYRLENDEDQISICETDKVIPKGEIFYCEFQKIRSGEYVNYTRKGQVLQYSESDKLFSYLYLD